MERSVKIPVGDEVDLSAATTLATAGERETSTTLKVYSKGTSSCRSPKVSPYPIKVYKNKHVTTITFGIV